MVEPCECSQLDWTGCDLTAAHHPACTAEAKRRLAQNFRETVEVGQQVIANNSSWRFIGTDRGVLEVDCNGKIEEAVFNNLPMTARGVMMMANNAASEFSHDGLDQMIDELQQRVEGKLVFSEPVKRGIFGAAGGELLAHTVMGDPAVLGFMCMGSHPAPRTIEDLITCMEAAIPTARPGESPEKAGVYPFVKFTSGGLISEGSHDRVLSTTPEKAIELFWYEFDRYYESVLKSLQDEDNATCMLYWNHKPRIVALDWIEGEIPLFYVMARFVILPNK